MTASSARFDELYERLVAVPLVAAGFERHGKSLYFRDEIFELGLVRLGGRFSGPGLRSLLFTFRHRFLRDLELEIPEGIVRDAFACPFKFDPFHLEETEDRSWHYEPQNLNFQPLMLLLEPIGEGELRRLLARLCHLVLEIGLPWARRMDPEEVRRQLVQHGEGAWVEAIWLEDYDRHLGPPAGGEPSTFLNPAPAPGTVEHLFDSQYLKGEHLSWAQVPSDGVYSWFPQFVRGISEVGGASRRPDLLRQQASCPPPMDSYAAYGLALAGVISPHELGSRVLSDIADGFVEDRAITNIREVFVRATELWPEGRWLEAVKRSSQRADRISWAAFDFLAESSPEQAAVVLTRMDHDLEHLVRQLLPRLGEIGPGLDQRIAKTSYHRSWLPWRKKRRLTSGEGAQLLLFAIRKKRSGECLAPALRPALLSILSDIPEDRPLSEGLCEAFESLPLEEREAALRAQLEWRWELVGRCPTPEVLATALLRLSKLRGKKAELAARSLARMGEWARPTLLAEYDRARGHSRSTLARTLELAAPE